MPSCATLASSAFKRSFIDVRSWRCHTQRTPAGEIDRPRCFTASDTRTWPQAGCSISVPASSSWSPVPAAGRVAVPARGENRDPPSGLCLRKPNTDCQVKFKLIHLIAVVDGLKGFPEAIGAVFPLTTVQTCIIHLIRNSLAFVSWKDRKLIMPDLKAIYRAETAEAGAAELDNFEAQWGQRYPAIGQAWRRAWEHVVPLFAFPPAIRKMIYTTNAVESLHRSLRKIIKTRGSFPTDEAALKLLFLAIRNAGVHWRRPIEWTAAVGQFAILFGDRFEPSAR